MSWSATDLRAASVHGEHLLLQPVDAGAVDVQVGRVDGEGGALAVLADDDDQAVVFLALDLDGVLVSLLIHSYSCLMVYISKLYGFLFPCFGRNLPAYLHRSNRDEG